MKKICVKEDAGEKIGHSYYFPIFIGIGLIFGVVLNQIAIGLCLGVDKKYVYFFQLVKTELKDVKRTF